MHMGVGICLCMRVCTRVHMLVCWRACAHMQIYMCACILCICAAACGIPLIIQGWGCWHIFVYLSSALWWRVTHTLCVILRHCCQRSCSAPLFLPERLKIETFMLSECTFPPGSVQLWVSDIGSTTSRAIHFPGYHWLAPVGLCEEKPFWQDSGAQRSCWKLGEGQCLWNQESSGGVWEREMASPWLSAEVLGSDLPTTAKGRNPQRWSHGWGGAEGQKRTMICSSDTQRACVMIT